MKETLLKLSVKLQTLMLREEGQDLIEYALVVALIRRGKVLTLGVFWVLRRRIFVSAS